VVAVVVMSDPSLPPVRFSDHRRQFRARFVPAGVTNKALAAVQRSRDRRAMGAQQRTDRPSASVPGREYIGLMAVSSPDLKAFLVVPFFGGLSDASLNLLVSMLVGRRFDVGATILSEGEPGCSSILSSPASSW